MKLATMKRNSELASRLSLSALFLLAAVLFGACNLDAQNKGEEVIIGSGMYTVTFYTYDSNSSSVKVKSGDTVDRPLVNPARPGYNFTGWYTAPIGGTVYDFSTPISGDTSIYARWQVPAPTDRTVTFYTLNGNSTDVIVTVGNTVDKPVPDPARSGYDFLGWYTSSSGGVLYDFSTPVTADMTLYARWQLTVYYTVTFYTYNGGSSAVTVVSGDPVARPSPDPTRDGYTFVGWYTASSGGDVYDFTAPVMGDTSVYAQWLISPSSVTVIGGTGSGEYAIGDLVTISAILIGTQAGLGNAGWATNVQSFQNWTVNTGNATLANSSSWTTTFIMPSTSVTVTANKSAASGSTNITSAAAYPIRDPAAGNYPQSLFMFPFSSCSGGCYDGGRENYTETLEWSPAVVKTFAPDTVYSAILTFAPSTTAYNVNNLTLANISNLPSGSAVNHISGELRGGLYVVTIVYNSTGSVNAPRATIFSDSFPGTSFDTTKWAYVNQENRQGFSAWRNSMVSVNNQLNIGFQKDTNNTLGFGANGIIAGGLTTAVFGYSGQISSVLFENSYGYFEASIRCPAGYSGTGNLPWGGFWLMGRMVGDSPFGGAMGTEKDILETINNGTRGWDSGLIWNGYGGDQGSVGRYNNGTFGASPNVNYPFTAVDIYDGNFHTFGLDWSPAGYKFYVDGYLFWDAPEGYTDWWNNMNQTVLTDRNPGYIMLSVEAAQWQNNGPWPTQWNGTGKMEVQWVKVWNQPPQ